MELLIGLLFVTLAGLATGTGAWPYKVIKNIHFEQWMFWSMLFAIVIYPWSIFLIGVPDPILLIKTVGFKTLLFSNLLTTSWGIANVLYMICVIRIGAALTGAILSALGMSVGVTLPLILKGSGLFTKSPDLFSTPGILIMVGLIIIIIGVILVSKAGFGREKILKNESGETQKKQASGDFRKGLLLVLLAGVLSCGLGLSFVYGQGPIIEAAKQQGAGNLAANFTVWALVCVGGAIINIGYASFWMTKKKTWKLLFARKEEFLISIVAAAQFIIGVTLMGSGMVYLGILGASVGYGIMQSVQVLGNQLVGFAGGEWKGVKGTPRKTMYLALGVILIAVIIFAYSNTVA